jgi:hypothetical protein
MGGHVFVCLSAHPLEKVGYFLIKKIIEEIFRTIPTPYN